VRIIFKNTELKKTDTQLNFYRTNKECEFALNKTGKKKYAMQYLTERDLTPPAPEADAVPAAPVIAAAPVSPALASTPDPVIQAVDPAADSPVTAPAQGCPAMTGDEFSLFKKAVLLQSTDASRQQAIYTGLQNGCLLTSQLKEVLSSISSEKVRLDVAKAVYPRIKDLGNYSQLLNNFLQMEEEFKTFMSSHK
jgi:uncharacterized protein DUF4476